MGPMTLEVLQKAARNGLVKKNDLVWKDGWPDWKPASKVPELVAAMTPETDKVQPTTTSAPDPQPAPSRAPLAYHTPPSARGQAKPGWNWSDFINFRLMLAVPFVKIVFIVGVVIGILWALVAMVGSVIAAMNTREGGIALIGIPLALIGLVLGLFVWRLYCELFIVIFRINDTLTEIKHELERRNNDG